MAGDDTDGFSGPVTVWRRPQADEVPLHRYCDLVPVTSAAAGDPLDPDCGIRYVRGVTRVVLRYTPTIIAVALLLVVATGNAAETYALGPIGSFDRAGVVVPFLIGGILWVTGLLWLLSRADVLSRGGGALRTFFVYGLIAVLVTGVVLALFSVTSGRFVPATATGLPPGVTFASGFLLMLLLGGLLVYDGMLRTENMFAHLDDKEPSIIEPPPVRTDETTTYGDFLADFRASLDRPIFVRGPVTVRTVSVFAAWFVVPFLVTGVILVHGSAGDALAYYATNPVQFLIALIPAVLDFFLVVVFFQFLVLIKYFNRLLRDHTPDAAAPTDFRLRYNPTHPDGYAGYRDMGAFATRVNTLLLVGGSYAVYRIYVDGLPRLPAGADPITLRTINWTFQYFGPLVVYIIAVVVWVYFSFWQIHKAMRRGREAELRAAAVDGDAADPDEYRLHQSGPVWPINTRVFLSMLSADLIPVFLGLFSALRL